MLVAIPEAQLEAYSREIQREFEGPPPQPANVEAAITLADSSLLTYRRRRFRVPPIPARQGFMLRALEARLGLVERGELSRENLRERLALLEEMVALMWVLVQPLGWWDRLTWRWRANPFRTADAGELVVLLNFFFAARTTTTVSWIWSDRAPHRWNTTWPPTSQSSPRTFLRGSTPTVPTGAIPSPGGTSWLDAWR